MKKRWIMSVAVCVGLVAQAQQTNVLLIIADDLGIESLSGFNDDPTASFSTKV